MKNYLSSVVVLLLLLKSGCSAYNQYVGNPDDTAKIERPCPTYDLNCIRVFFQNHAHCKISFGPVPEPITRAQENIFLPRVNITSQTPLQENSGINGGRIEEFYINRATDNLVIAVKFRNITQRNLPNYFKIHRRAKEPVVTSGDAVVVFENLVITAIIPKIDELQLQDAECTTFSEAAVARFVLSPTALQSDDADVQAALVEFNLNLPNVIQEIFLTVSSYYIGTFIQYNICDFGLFLT